jgi:hypothetical protein
MSRRSLCFPARVYWWPCTILLMAVTIMACSEKSTKNNKTVVTVKSFSVVPSVIQKGQSSVVDVVVEDDANRAISGAQVSFSVAPATIGYCSPSVDTTDANGSAATVFTSTDFGTATIQASIEGVASKTVQVEVVTSGGTTKLLEIEVTPSWLPANGTSICTVKVAVSDSVGDLASDGTVVKFAAGEKFEDVDRDGYFTEGIDQLEYDVNQNGRWDPIGFMPSYALTQNGAVKVSYVSGLRTGTVYIKITSQVGETLLQADASLLLVPTDSVAYMVLTPDNGKIQVRGTGGTEATQIRAVCFDNNGNRVGSDFPVEFYIINGPGGGEALNGVASDSITVKTNSDGEATVTLSSGTVSGPVRMRAKVGKVLSYSTLVTICSGPPADISLGVTPCNIRGWDVNCVQASICACVVDVYGNPVPDSTEVHFGTEEGMVKCCDKTKQGCAYSTYLSGDPRNDGRARIWAETYGDNGILRDTCLLIVSGPPASVTFQTYPASLLADGVSKGDVVVEVLDVNDNLVLNQTPVTMKTNFGSIPSGVTTDGCHASVFETELTSEVLGQDYSMTYSDHDDGIGVEAVLSARSGFVSNSVYVTLLTGPTYSKNCDVDIEATIPHGATVPVVVIIRDRYGNPLGGHLVEANQARTSGGTVTGSSHTNSYGEATGFTFTTTTDPAVKSGIVSFCDEDPRGGVCIAAKVSISED